MSPKSFVSRWGILAAYALVSLTMIGGAALILTKLGTESTVNSLIAHADGRARNTAQHLNLALLRTYNPPGPLVHPLTEADLADRATMDSWLPELLYGLGVLGVHVYGADGNTLYDDGVVSDRIEFDETAERGRIEQIGLGYHVAPSVDIDSADNGRKVALVSSYAPLFDNPKLPMKERNLIGIIEIHQDIREELATTLTQANEQRLFSLVVPLLTLFITLSIVAYLGERALKAQVVRAERLQAQANELTLVQQHVLDLQGLNAALQQRTAESEQASLAKSEFLANMSHELRTPLNAIIGFSDVLLADAIGPLEEEQTEAVGEIRDAGRHLLLIVSDILDIARIEAGKLRIDKVDCALPDVLNEVVRTVTPLALSKHQTLTVSLDPSLPAVVADPARLRQVAMNLLGNALKFTPDGGTIRLEAAVRNGRAQVDVIDDGPGIPADRIKGIFGKFERVERRGERTLNEGTGLGLALAQELMELHDGELWCESVYGQGCRFSFTLPLAGEPSAQEDEEPLQEVAA